MILISYLTVSLADLVLCGATLDFQDLCHMLANPPTNFFNPPLHTVEVNVD
jgi:hypothetical protein